MADHFESCVTQNLSHHMTIGEREAQILSELEQDPQEVKKGHELWTVGMRPEQLYTLRSGWAYSYHCLGENTIRVLDIFIPGDLMGIRDATLPHHYTTAVMLTDGIICPFPTGRIKDIFEAHPNLAMGIHASAARQQAVITDRLINVLSNDARCRIAHFILEIYYRIKRVHGDLGSGFTLPLLQKHISLALGLTHVHVSRILKELHEDNVIKKTRTEIEILDLTCLHQISNFDTEKFGDGMNPLLAGDSGGDDQSSVSAKTK
ncbi:Crp/Fnr family transcriptional regulator [Modicisalibacter xianhensis]|uniref:cAMP-binding domain of CRP or a regulatory subunit of cAMP-dependent protein kinases n=1 Tax=Modicisalibacter xianhensis TaxID=442341 RepID=A0A1I2YPG1_9GAMM|nr:Crp/Fnr family transcriptional regulator [Halomonas xianhensis]SFH27435.1 cAMP-binding domain of CRP or a regulatory subunit of cAMP-dependent protein kinases [Halomonas xianhensis]